jgi:DNA-binding CsgD family transcriptional regulator
MHRFGRAYYRLVMVSLSDRVERTSSAVQRVCSGAESADALLEGLSAVMHVAVPHAGSTWFGVDPATMLATAPSRIEHGDAGLCDTFWHVEFHEQDTAQFADLARGAGAAALRLALDDRPGRSIRYREFMQPQGYHDELRAVFQTGTSTWGVVGLYRDNATKPFDEGDLAVVKSVSRLVADAFRRHVRAANPWLGPPSAPGLLMIDGDGHVASTNAEAIGWLRELWPSALRTDADDVSLLDVFDVADRDVEVPTPLYALVAKARAIADGRERGPARLRVRDRRGRWLVLHASVLSRPTNGAGTVAVVIEAAKSAEVAPIVIEAYSLTPRERDVLAALARGESTAEIAAALYLSPHTVRDYVKAVFEKFAVSSRGELVARLFGEHYTDLLHQTMVHND